MAQLYVMPNYYPYSIYTPEFDPTSGGIRVMWGLLGWLLAKGQLAVANARWHTPFNAIYPEIIHGNPFGSERVVRYILNRPGVMASYGVPGPQSFGDDEIYVFSRIYDTFNVDDEHILFLPILNLHIFKDYKRNRTQTCYFVGKGTDQNLHPADSIPITREFAQDQQQLAELLNNCHTMYTYENPTAMNEIARLCGCKVVFFPEGSATPYTKKELETLYEPGMQGVAFGRDDSVQLDVKKFRKTYIELIREFEKKLDTFIIHTQT